VLKLTLNMCAGQRVANSSPMRDYYLHRRLLGVMARRPVGEAHERGGRVLGID